MTNLKQSIKEQNSDRLKEIKEKSRNNRKEKAKLFFGNVGKKIATLFVGRARMEYKTFLNMHDETKIGILERGTTKKGATASVVYTQQGPIIQTSVPNIYLNRPSKLKLVDVNIPDKALSVNATFEGYIQSYEGVWIYAKVSKKENWKEDVEGIHSGDCSYDVIVRNENGCFVTIKNAPSNDHILIRGKKYPCAQKIFFDLQKRFESELQKIK